MAEYEPRAMPLAAEGIRLNAESVRAELEEASASHDLSPMDAELIERLSDDRINTAIRDAADDAFWEQYDGVRRRAIARLTREIDG